MYNRYLRNDEGEYTRVPIPETSPVQEQPPPPHPSNMPPAGASPPPKEAAQLFSHLLQKLPLQGVDKGDLLLLLILFFLFEEKADDELLIALGLLLIL